MWFDLDAAEIDFLDRAPRRWEVEVQVNAPRMAVWEAFVDPKTWHLWFPGVIEASYPGSTPPYGVGTRRFSHVGRQYYEETMLAWDEGTRWAYRIDRTTLPLSAAHVECTDFEDDGDHTLLRWTLAARPRMLLRLGSPFMEGMLRRLLKQAARNLEGYLHSQRIENP